MEMPMEMRKIIEKRLSETDIKHRLAFPSDSIRIFWDLNVPNTPHSCDFHVADRDGRKWPLHLAIRKQGYPKPEITGRGWLNFVRAKGLKPYDILVFYDHPGEDEGGPLFTVALRRANWENGTFKGYFQQE